MTQEDKKLLLKDLCARLPYDTIVSVTDGTIKYNAYIESISYKNIQVSPVSDSNFTAYTFYKISDIKPYLRPMSSMTEEELQEYNMHLLGITIGVDAMNFMIWIYQHHLDILKFIDKGLALEAPEGMYNIKKK